MYTASSELPSFFPLSFSKNLTKALPTFWILCCQWSSFLRISPFWAWVLESEKSWIPIAVLPPISLVTIWTSLFSPVKQESWYYLPHMKIQWDAVYRVPLRARSIAHSRNTCCFASFTSWRASLFHRPSAWTSPPGDFVSQFPQRLNNGVLSLVSAQFDSILGEYFLALGKSNFGIPNSCQQVKTERLANRRENN